MAIDAIVVDSTASTALLAARLLDYKRKLRAALDAGTSLLGELNHLQDGSDWASIEARTGVGSGLGDDVYNLVNGSVGAMNGTFQNDDCKQLTEQVIG
jgi:hypothetical protein